MALDLNRINELAEEQAAQGQDLNKPQSGGGDYVPPAAGQTRLRFVKYVETGVHSTKGMNNTVKTKPRADIVFELSGPKHPPKVLDDGRKIPHLIVINEVVGGHMKNNYIKLFKAMAAAYPGAKNYAQLLGKEFLGTVYHREWKRADGSVGVSAELKAKDSGFSIRSTQYEDPESTEIRRIKVDQALTPFALFLWDRPDLDQWDSIYVPGEYDDGNTKNKVQEKIKAAENFTGSPIYDVLVEAGRADELIPAPKFDRKSDNDDQPAPPPEGDEQEGTAEGQEQAQETPKPEVKAQVAKTPVKAVAKAVAKPAAVAAKPATKAVVTPKPVVKKQQPDNESDPLAGI
jgi:hypothetical protein